MNHGGKGKSHTDDDAISPLAIAAHELKSPLALIRQLSFEIGDATTNEQRVRLADEIRVISERALRLSSNITKAEHLQLDLLESSVIKPWQICEEVRRELTPLYKANGKQLHVKGNSRSPLIVANYDLLRRILLNFGDNALHYSDDDGAVMIFVSLIHKKNTVRIGVRDDGPMLPKNIVKSLFGGKPAAQMISTRPESSGLGLVIAKEFSRAIGGTIGAVRHRDGASFYVDVPVSQQLALL